MWLVIDGYEDEPAAFGVPPYIGFHIRYICGVLESHGIDYRYITIDQWRRGEWANSLNHDTLVGNKSGVPSPGASSAARSAGGNSADRKEITGCVLLAGAIGSS